MKHGGWVKLTTVAAALMLSFSTVTGCASNKNAAPETAVPTTGQPSDVSSASATPSATPSRKPMLTANEMLNAPVPSLCDHPAGRLVKGKHPGIKSGSGVVEIDFGVGDWKTKRFASWRDSKGEPRAAVVINCNAGGVSWSSRLVMYGPGPTVLGAIDVREVTNGSRERITRIVPRGNGVRGYVTGILAWEECEACADGDAIADFTWTGSRIRGKLVSEANHKVISTQALNAAVRGDQAGIKRYFATSARAEAGAMKDSQPTAWKITQCNLESEGWVCSFRKQGSSLGGDMIVKRHSFMNWSVTSVSFW